jgi:EAL domain-containing protein (putative c-di-GMP-specific phosphodiesterase class I)
MSKVAGRDLAMNVNVSPRQLQSDDFVDLVRGVLDDTGLPAGQLALELTESVLVDQAVLVDRLRTLRGLGVHLALDDLGTGFSSYSYLQRLPIDAIKIDRSFVERLDGPAGQPELVGDIIRMSKALRLYSIAEGVETTHQLAALRRLGCPFAQGFLFARPMDRADALARVMRRARRSVRASDCHRHDHPSVVDSNLRTVIGRYPRQESAHRVGGAIASRKQGMGASAKSAAKGVE